MPETTTQIPVRFAVELAVPSRGWERVYVQRIVNLPAVPRVGDDVELEPGGWSEPVVSVLWTAHEEGAAVDVELGQAGRPVEYDPDRHDLAAVARDAGWTVHEPVWSQRS